MTLRLLTFAALLTLSACSCGPKNPIIIDAGPQDAGVDAGVEDAGAQDAGFDAGVVDAGPAPVLKIKKVLPPRGGSAGGTNVLLQGSGFIRDFATRGTEAKKVTTLKFGSNSVIDYQIIDDETLELRSPPGLAGPAHIVITNPLGTFTCNSCFTYFDELIVSGISPKEGPLAGGNEVTIDGQGFTSDVEVLFGVFASPKVTFVSSRQLKVLVPRGQLADLVDITVYNKNGVANARRVYRYFADLRILAVAPLTGPLAGGTLVTLTGTGFSDATSLKFGAADATSFTVLSDTTATAVSPAGAALGAVDLTFVTPRDGWTAKKAFTYFDPAGSFAVFSVFPHVARPGDVVTVTGQALDTPGLTVTLGGVAAAVGATGFSTAQLTVPFRGAAARKSDVTAAAGASSATLPQGFTWRLGVASVAPDFGPAAGGTQVSLGGSALPADAEVFFGALKGTSATVANEAALSVTTAPGSGGAASDVRVREAADPENEAVLKAAFTFEEPLSIGRVQPERGAIAGNTLVTVLGAGFREGVTISFGLNKAKDVKIVDSHTVTCRTPKGEAGVVDVAVDRLTAHDELPGGFSYYDPRSISGGLSGGPLVGTLNISVLDATQGFYGTPVPLATVMLGIDAATPFQGLTDGRGQLTFSDTSLVKAQVVTVFKDGYESATVTNVSAENLTVFISRTGGGDGNPGNPPPGPPRSQIAGRVTGFKAPRPLATNEKLEARVFVAATSLFSGPPLGGIPNKQGEKWQVLVDGGEYLVFTSAGLHATYAILGIANATANSFTPFLMGVRRGITTSPDNPAVNQDIILDMHLDLTVPVTVDSPLSFPGMFGPEPGTNALYAWLDLGAEGFVPNPNNWKTGTASSSSISSAATTQSFPNFPRLDGSNFIFLNECAGTQSYPVSYYFRRQPGDLSLGVTIGPMLPAPEITQPTTVFNGTLAWNLAPGPTADIHQVQILKPTIAGNVTLWSVVLPGSEKQVVLPAPAVTKLRNEEAGQQLFVVIYSSRSPKFAYNQWTYDTLSGVTWSSFTISLSSGFTP